MIRDETTKSREGHEWPGREDFQNVQTQDAAPRPRQLSRSKGRSAWTLPGVVNWPAHDTSTGWRNKITEVSAIIYFYLSIFYTSTFPLPS